jgi:protocatechuate 3,4-dioxygenase beta subunit
LRAQNRHEFRPAHLHFLCFKPGMKTLVTQVFVDDDKHLHSDVVFGVTSHLIGDFRQHGADDPAPDGTLHEEWYSLSYTFVMEPGDAKLPKPPIA